MDPSNLKNGHFRVLMLIENLSFPFDRRMKQEALALTRAGRKVSVICPRGEDQDRSSYEWVQGIRVYRYPLPWQGTNVWTYLLEYGWALLCTFTLSIWIALRHGFDVIHAANPPDALFLVALGFKLFGKKFVYDHHDLCPEMYEAKFKHKGFVHKVVVFLERLSYDTADLVITTNQSYYDVARERGQVNTSKLCIVRSGPDLGRFQMVSARAELKEGFPFLAVYLGVMGRPDGVDRLVLAAHQLINVRQRRDTLFVVIGDGECRPHLEKLSKDFGLDFAMRFPGRISDEALLAYLSTADICLAPDPPLYINSVSTMNKVLEYMACKKPIVSFDLLESRRSAGPAAIYVEQDDPALFAAAIEKLLDDPQRRESMGEAGYQRIANELSWQHSEASLLAAYARLDGTLPAVRVPLTEAGD